MTFAALLSLQGIWLYYAYGNSKSSIESTLHLALINSIKMEMRTRFIKLEEAIETKTNNPEFIEFKLNYDEAVDSQQYNIMQDILAHENILFDLSALDSIYFHYLKEEKLFLKYQLLYTDSKNNLVAKTEHELTKGFRAEKVPIINGYHVEAIVKITPPVILKKMLIIFLSSVCIFIFINICMIYLIKMFTSIHHLNQLRENFTYALNHDLKTPLGTLAAIFYQLKEKTLDAEPEIKDQFIQTGIDQTINLQTIVNQILVVAYLNKKQLDLNIEPVNLQEITKNLINLFLVKGGKEIIFTEKYESNIKSVYVDKFYISNAISNLIDNAIKYSASTVKIDIHCSANDEHIYIRVRDNGFGISPKDKKKIFKRFERGEEVKRNKISGFGLGLNFVKEVIKAHKGTISICSKLGEGSEVTISIPILKI